MFIFLLHFYQKRLFVVVMAETKKLLFKLVILGMYLMQVCGSCFGQWEGKYEMLSDWVQVSSWIFSNLHLWGDSCGWFCCILHRYFLFGTYTVTRKPLVNPNQMRCGYFEDYLLHGKNNSKYVVCQLQFCFIWFQILVESWQELWDQILRSQNKL